MVNIQLQFVQANKHKIDKRASVSVKWQEIEEKCGTKVKS